MFDCKEGPDCIHCWVRAAGTGNRLVGNMGRRCYVDGVNTAAKASTGRILIVNADDQFAAQGWDDELLASASIASMEGYRAILGNQGLDFVVEVSTGTPTEHERGIMVMPILSRARYERLGHVFYPEYESMFADNDFAEHAQQDGVVIDARHLVFPHKHWTNGQRKSDPVDSAQNAEMSYMSGARILERRRANKFAGEPARKESAVSEQSDQGAEAVRPPVLAICTPGETFSQEFVSMLRRLDFYLQHNFILQPVMGHATEPWRIRQEMSDGILGDSWQPKPDYVLWVDDDNLLTVEQFNQLFEVLTDRKLDMIAGTCWIQYGDQEPYNFVPSFGWFNESRNQIRYAAADALTGSVVEAGWTGFPVVLMRREVLERAGKWAFRPIVDDQAATGLLGEDISFCRRVADAGIKIHVHTGVKVPHLKTRAIEPEYVVKERAALQFEDTDKSATINPFPNRDNLFDGEGNRRKRPRIIGAMRVKNEGRWIKRCIESLFPLCDAVYVMDDGSTDGTVDEANRCLKGEVEVITSPFLGLGLDEARDKNYLLAQVASEKPNYILWIDGDEELEPGGAEKILRAIAEHPETPAFNLRFYYLWNNTKTVRWDRWYAGVKRPSLFKNINGVRFRSFYEGRGVHSGLHTSNCPFDLTREVRDTDCFLIHYGYIFGDDRIAKYQYYNRLDPNNPMEDGYRHMVIGDVFPSDSVFAHAGPLMLVSAPFDISPLACESRECESSEQFDREYDRMVTAM